MSRSAERTPGLGDVTAEEILGAAPDAFFALDDEWRFTYVNAAAEPLLDRRAADLVGRVVWDEFPEAVDSVFEEQYTRAARDGVVVRFTAYYPPLHRWFAVQAVPQRAGLSVFFHDVTAHKEAEERAATLAAMHAGLREVATAVAAEVEPQAVFDLACRQSAGLVGASGAWLVRFDGDDAYEVLAATEPAGGPRPATGDRVAVRPGTELDVARRGEAVVVTCVRGGRLGELGLGAAVVVPVRLRGAVWGALAVGWVEPRDDAAEHEPWLHEFAELVAVAVGNADARRALARQAATDPLTGLANLRTLHAALDERVARGGGAWSLALVDVDHFKLVNDGHGHEVGDRVLQVVADALRDTCGPGDVAARVGGDEFALLLGDVDAAGALGAARRVREAIAAGARERGLPAVTASVGVCDWEPGLDREATQRRADDALYWAKVHGRDAAWAYRSELMDAGDAAREAAARRRAGAVPDPSGIEAGLRSAHGFWQSALDGLTQQVAVLDEDGRIVATNAAWRRFAAEHGGDPERTGLGTSYLAACDADPAAAVVADGLRALLRGERHGLEVDYPCHHDGRERWFTLRADRFGDDRPCRIIVHHQDVTERRRAEQSSAFQATLLDAVALPVFALGVDLRVTYWNRAAELLLGRPAAEVLGRPVDALALFDPRGVDLGAMEARVRTEGRADWDITGIDASGRRFPASVTTAAVRDADGRPAGYIGTVVDLAEKVPGQRELAAARRLLAEADSLRWAQRIRAALDEDRLELHAQPIVALRTGRVVDHELLVRMRDEDGALVQPGAFLPAAEEHGLVTRIDRWVAERAIEYSAAGHPVHINLSARSVGDLDLLVTMRRAIERTGANPRRITVELTETALIADRDRAAAFARHVRRIGLRVALDDFGAGYNGFARVKDLPADILKIDRQFVSDLVDQPASESVVRAILGFAADLGLEVIAEGVEDAATVERLRELGVGLAQGFHLGRPAPLTR